MTTAIHPRSLTVGDLAPDFELESLDGTGLRLSQLRGRPVLVALLRNAQCALCNLWVHETSKRAPAWRDRGLHIVAVFESTADKLRAHLDERPVPFPIVADPDGRAHEAFGSHDDPALVHAIAETPEARDALRRAMDAGFAPRMEEGSNFFRIPAEVLVGPDGRVAHVHHADRVTNHLSPAVVDDFLRTLQLAGPSSP